MPTPTTKTRCGGTRPDNALLMTCLHELLRRAIEKANRSILGTSDKEKSRDPQALSVDCNIIIIGAYRASSFRDMVCVQRGVQSDTVI